MTISQHSPGDRVYHVGHSGWVGATINGTATVVRVWDTPALDGVHLAQTITVKADRSWDPRQGEHDWHPANVRPAAP